MRKILAGILLFCALTASAQEEWYIGKPIRSFTFTGLESVAGNELTALVQPYIDRDFSLELFWEIQEKLYALDYFESIESNALPADGETGVIVEFVVKEKPSVADIVLEGNRQLRRAEILEKVLIKKGDLVTQAQVNADTDAIAAVYVEKGFTEASVTGSLEAGKEGNTVEVRFRIVEGVQTAIRAIAFSGNSFASESTLRRLMKTKPQSLFSSGLFQEAKLEEDLAGILEYYGEHGFVDARIDKVDRAVERDDKEGKNFLTITIYLSEGEQWVYGGMSFEGNQIFSTEQLAELVRQTPGKLLDKSRLEADTQRVADLYYENGYIFNSIGRDEVRDEQKKEIAYTIRILEKERAHIESIELKGNTKTKDYVILRELPFAEGDIFSKAKVVQGLRNLYNLQYFTSVQPETPEGSVEGLMDLVINVEEGSTANINFGVTFSGGDYPISGVLKWSENNFLGRGQAVGVNLEISNLRQMAALSFTEPWLFGKRWSGGVNLSFEHALVPNIYQDIDGPLFNGDEDFAVPDPFDGHLVDPDDGSPGYTGDDAITDYEYAVNNGYSIPDQYTMDYTTWKFAAGLESGYRAFTPLGWLGVRGGLSVALEKVEYDPALYRPFDPVIRLGQGIWQNINKVGLTLFWDKRDYFLNPSKGFYLAQGVTFAVGFPLGRREYIRTDTTLEGFLTLVDWQATENWKLRLILAGHSSLHFILPQLWNDQALTITNDRLYIDGWNIARGWPLERDLFALWDNRLELRMPIAEQLLWWVFFFDAVAGYEEANGLRDLQLDDFLFSFGGGIRFSIPQFPIRLYLAKRFKTVNGQVQWQEGDLPFFGATVDFVISLGGDTF